MIAKYKYVTGDVLLYSSVYRVLGAIWFLFVCAFLAHSGTVLPRVQNYSFDLYEPSSTPEYAFDSLVSTTFTSPMSVAFIPPLNDHFLVGELIGLVKRVDRAGNTTTVLDLRDRLISGYGESGLYSLALHPAFPLDNRLFVTYSGLESNSAFNTLSSFEVDVAGGWLVDEDAENILIRQDWGSITPEFHPPVHFGSEISFGPDGYLYFTMGDGGFDDPQLQMIDGGFFSGMFRIDVDENPASLAPNPHLSSIGSYRVPPDNPYVGATSFNGQAVDPTLLRTEYYAVGLRNPWRHTITPAGDIYLGDVGWNSREELNQILPGNNYGWGNYEGDWDYLPPPVPYAHTLFIHMYWHGSGSMEGDAISDSILYNGVLHPELDGLLLFCDFISGHIWSINPNHPNPSSTVTNVTDLPRITGFINDPLDGEVVAISLNGGIHKLIKQSPNSGVPKPLLSQAGIFQNMSTRQVQAGVVPYEVNVPFWSDGANKSRWFIPAKFEDKFAFQSSGTWGAPAGMAWVKHFDLELSHGDPSSSVPVETRVLILEDDGLAGYSYRWDPPYTNATLVAELGSLKTVVRNDNGQTVFQTWTYPSRTQCGDCHNEAAGGVLGFTSAQLNRNILLNGTAINQITALAQGPYVGVHESPTTLPRLADWDRQDVSLCYRVKSYLQVNCAMCHQPGGSPANWDARMDMAFNRSGLPEGVPLFPLPGGGSHLLLPGQPNQSVLLQRLASINPGVAMPPIGHSLLDTQAIHQIMTWIEGMDDPLTYADWQSQHFSPSSSTGAAGADPDNDGCNNTVEWTFGLDPLAPSSGSFFQMDKSPSGLKFEFPMQAGFTYQIESSPAISPPSWTNVFSKTATYTLPRDCQAEFELPMPPNPTPQFFRLFVEP